MRADVFLHSQVLRFFYTKKHVYTRAGFNLGKSTHNGKRTQIDYVKFLDENLTPKQAPSLSPRIPFKLKPEDTFFGSYQCHHCLVVATTTTAFYLFSIFISKEFRKVFCTGIRCTRGGNDDDEDDEMTITRIMLSLAVEWWMAIGTSFVSSHLHIIVSSITTTHAEITRWNNSLGPNEFCVV